MAKAASELKAAVTSFIDLLSQDMIVEKVFLWGDYVSGKPAEHSAINLVVVSPAFEGCLAAQRSEILAKYVLKSDPLITAYGFTPEELSRVGSGRGEPLLGMMLHESQEVFDRAPAGPRTSR